MNRSLNQSSYSGAIAQILLLGFAAAVLLTMLGFLAWARWVQRQGYPFELVLALQLIALVFVGFILLAWKRTERWSHFGTFLVLFCGLTLVTIVTLFAANQMVKNEDREEGIEATDAKVLMSSLDSYVNSATICLTRFEGVTNKETADKSLRILTQELSSLGGTVRSFAWRQDDIEIAELVKEAEVKVQAMNARLKVAIENARARVGDDEPFLELCERYLRLVNRVERKEHLKR